VLRYLFDEHLRGPLWNALQRHNLQAELPLDVIRVGDSPDVPLASSDRDILNWTELHERILVSHDKSTLPVHLADHLRDGRHCPGIFILLGRTAMPELLEILTLAAYASDPAEWRDRIQYVR
jgi:hypothetical protein